MFEGKYLSKDTQRDIARFSVAEISYNDKREIEHLVIVDKDGVVVWRTKK